MNIAEKPNYKQKCEQAVEIIESCFDENNPNDNSDFNSRLGKRIDECTDEDLQLILLGSFRIDL